MLVLRYVVERLLHALPVLLGVTLLAFVAIKFVPGDPIRIMTHGRISDAEVEAIYQRMGMDRPLPVQFVSFVGKALTGDLGQSIVQRAPVGTLIVEKLWPTLWLLGLSTLFAILLAVPLAMVAARAADRPQDHIIRIGSMVGFAMPPFLVALLLMLFFGLWLGWFPISGYGSDVVERLHHLVLPAVTIAVFLAPILIQSLRASMLEVMTADYVEVARAKGLSEWRILSKHVLRNALIPVLTVLAVNITWLLSGAVIVEYVFSLPGLGSLLVRSVGFRDYPLIQGLALVFGILVVLVNLTADILYVFIDPRVARR